ncbi:MAG: hypothetical protein KGJ98_07310 [Chloroflexota bacterium]|nr:hypothetical protein [Chloroflexota bacterium]
MSVLALHSRFAFAVLYYLVALGIWGVVLGIRRQGPSPSFRGAIVIVEIAILAQGLLGGLTWLSGQGPPRDLLHILYGFALLLALPFASTMVRDSSPRRAALTLGLVAFFAAGLAIRGITTGSV